MKPLYYTVAEGTMWKPWTDGEVSPQDLKAAVNPDFANRDSPRFQVNATFFGKTVHSFLFTELNARVKKRWDCYNGWTKG